MVADRGLKDFGNSCKSSQKVVRLHHNVERLKPIWKINDHASASEHLIKEGASVNWMYVGQAAAAQLVLDVENYKDHTSIANQNVDHFFMVEVANGKLTMPVAHATDYSTTEETVSNPEVIGGTLSNPEVVDGNLSNPPEIIDDNTIRKVFKVFFILVDERNYSGPTPSRRATTLFVYHLRDETGAQFVQTTELIEQLQLSSERVVGSARLSVALSVSGISLRSAFYTIRGGAETVGISDIPELQVEAARAGTGCDCSVTIYLDDQNLPDVQNTKEPNASSNAFSKRRASVLSSDSEQEYRGVTVKLDRSTPSIRAASIARINTTARDDAQLRWLRGPSGNTPEDDCEEAGRTSITNACLATFLERTADWIGKAKIAGALQVEASHIPAVKAHLDGDVANDYLGVKAWTDFLKAAIAGYKKAQVEAELKGTTID
ncbi:hypothetical protein R3P38DRAFT_2813847 [Favolaschia claudopus]|uniref:Uncharacterized protein n=1 Tax=Favolaschia claudopus TaxID=2862362 RepID=A0AAV9Z4Y4_9AGAR